MSSKCTLPSRYDYTPNNCGFGEFPCFLRLSRFELSNELKRLPRRRSSHKSDRVGARYVVASRMTGRRRGQTRGAFPGGDGWPPNCSDEKRIRGGRCQARKSSEPRLHPHGPQTTALGLRPSPAPLMSQFEACKSASSRAAELSAATTQACRATRYPAYDDSTARNSELMARRGFNVHGIARIGCGFRAANGPRHLTLRARSPEPWGWKFALNPCGDGFRAQRFPHGWLIGL